MGRLLAAGGFLAAFALGIASEGCYEIEAGGANHILVYRLNRLTGEVCTLDPFHSPERKLDQRCDW